MLDPGVPGGGGQAARQAAARWTFEHHYRALLDVFREARALRQAA